MTDIIEYNTFVTQLNKDYFEKYKSNIEYWKNRNEYETQREILKILQEKENNSTNNYQYWYHGEYDSNVSGFEYMMNTKLICLKTKLVGPDLEVLMGMFQILFDHRKLNYKFKSTDSDSKLKEILELFNSDECPIGGENYTTQKRKSKRGVFEIKDIISIF